MADDPWAAFKPEPALAAAADPWAAFKPEAPPQAAAAPAPTPAAEAGGDAIGTGLELNPIPQAYLDRVAKGHAINNILNKAVEGWKEGLGSEPVTGISDQTYQQMVELGIFHDPTKGAPGPVRLFNEALILPAAKAFETVLRGANAGLYSAASVLGQLHEELGGSQGEANRTKNEVINAGNWAMIEGGFGRFSRVMPTGEQQIGGLPRPADFQNAAKVLDAPAAEANLKSLWQEKGIHPAEALHDAQKDAFLKHDIVSKGVETEMPKEALETLDGAPRSLGAAVNDLPEGVPLTEQPAPAPGRLTAALKETGDKLFDIGRDIQMKVAPMATGTRDSMAMAKDFANTMRRNRWEWGRIDDDIAKRFTPEQRTRMWNAADEESVLRQEGQAEPPVPEGFKRFYHGGYNPTSGGPRWTTTQKDYARYFRTTAESPNEVHYVDLPKGHPEEVAARNWDAADEAAGINNVGSYKHTEMSEAVASQMKPLREQEHMGLATLEPTERAAVEDLQSRAQNAWLRARDLGMVEGEGLPAYTPRMVINATGEGNGPIPLNGIGMNLKTRTVQMRHREYLTAEETEAAAKKALGSGAEIARDIRTLPLATAKLEDAIAGRTLINNIKDYGKATGAETVAEGHIPAGSDAKWFTLDHPAFKTWRPKMDAGSVVKDAEGNVIFEQVPLYVHGDFEGPLRAVLTERSGPLYQAAMSLKGKTMGLIMNSPMIHNMVEFGRAFPAMPTRIVKAYFDGNRAKNDVAVMREAIDSGLVPIGKRFFNQDVSSIMEAPDLTPGRSWTAKVLAAVPGLFDEAAGVAVKRAIDKAGDFWHNTLLWDRIGDLQMGLYVNLRGDLLAKGVDQQTASRMAAHFANRYAGALPKEAMSDAAAKVANMMLFSRSFTLGNLGAMKDVLTGLPKDVLAQIERDMGPMNREAAGYAKSLARRKAFATVALDIGLLYVGNSILQSALNVMLGDSTLDQETHGYAKRAKEVLNHVETHPLSLLQPFSLAERLSATGENEPDRKERLKIGYAKDGTAIYARNPVGKIGEEFIGYLGSPLDMLKRKQGTIARPMLQILNNDRGFGRKIYDANAETPAQYASNIWAIVKHFAKSQFPEGQFNAFSDLVRGEGDPKVNALQSLGPIAGVTFSKGAPGGPAVGEMYKAREMHDFKVNMALPEIRRQIQRGDLAGAYQKMNDLQIPPGLQRFYVRTTQNPSTRLSGNALKNFYQYATPEQRARMENFRQQPGPLTPQQ